MAVFLAPKTLVVCKGFYKEDFWTAMGEGGFPETGRPCMAQRTAGMSPNYRMLRF